MESRRGHAGNLGAGTRQCVWKLRLHRVSWSGGMIGRLQAVGCSPAVLRPPQRTAGGCTGTSTMIGYLSTDAQQKRHLGCDSGFGEALARRLDSLGVPVVAGCLFPEGPGAQRLVQHCSSRLRVLPLDVTSEQQVRDAVSSIRDSLDGRELWALVNNAGMSDIGEAELVPLEVFERTLAVNTLGVVRVTQACLPLIRQAKGRIITVASPLGRTAMPIMSPYCMSKSAVISYCDALRVEMKKWGVSVCTVEPSSYMTGLNNPDHFKATISKNFQTCPLSVREAYGLDYDDKCTKRMSLLTFLAKRNPSIDEVIHELVDACIGRYFQVRRIPGLWERVVYVMLPQLPYFETDIINYLLLQWRMTVPPTAKSSEEQNETH
ncbi:short-chain dehydrogenase/reductase family 9C member 7-like [Schistocerca serialis cubense]|uniref:short-chain dehydrogenase/reductase family 9C member 7-like n=1 Tax=Schistocerca serialis cubense TaxID=2023355 RepID=UPI00214E68D8|nr:short-chain dehydrogenase/reductase family 9C member 7-like [Schistocerca serialis cubense]